MDYVGAAALPGFRVVVVDGQVVFVSDDGKHLIQGGQPPEVFEQALRQLAEQS